MARLVTGIDVVEIERFERFARVTAIEQLSTIFSARELKYVSDGADLGAALAARFAAKEAVMKVLVDIAPYETDWREIEILRESGAPRVQLHGATAEIARARGIVEIAISLSHSRRIALAHAIGVFEPSSCSDTAR